ncbi:MAG: hypothetical protein ACE15F_07060 [bacterium]
MKKIWMGIGIAMIACVTVYGVASAMMGSSATASADKTMVITSSDETPACCASKTEATSAHAALTSAEGECPMAKSVASAECKEAKGCPMSQTTTASAEGCCAAGKSEGQTALAEKAE